MPRLNSSTAIIAWIALALTSTGNSQQAEAAPDNIKAVIQQLYSAQDVATDRKDVAGMFLPFAPSYINTDTHGKTNTLAEAKQGAAHLLQMTQSISSHSLVESATRSGSTATVVVQQKINMVLVNPQDSGETAAVATIAVSRDTWVKTPAGWRETFSKTLSENDTLNGKPFDPSQPQAPSPGSV